MLLSHLLLVAYLQCQRHFIIFLPFFCALLRSLTISVMLCPKFCIVFPRWHGDHKVGDPPLLMASSATSHAVFSFIAIPLLLDKVLLIYHPISAFWFVSSNLWLFGALVLITVPSDPGDPPPPVLTATSVSGPASWCCRLQCVWPCQAMQAEDQGLCLTYTEYKEFKQQEVDCIDKQTLRVRFICWLWPRRSWGAADTVMSMRE